MYCYRFPSQATFRALATDEGLINEDDELITASHEFAIKEIGILTTGGTADPTTGEVLTPPVQLPGWHVNTMGLAPEVWDQYLTIVNTPSYVFLGGPTQAPSTEILEAM